MKILPCLALLLVGATATATAQQSSLQPDSAPAQIHTRLRSFYFNLAHRDWEALTADILAAKVVAHRSAPEAFVTAVSQVGGSSSAAPQRNACYSSAVPLVDNAIIRLDGDWAEVSVPRCGATLGAIDEFRLVHFDKRWRFVSINLFEEPLSLSTDR
jgi:hypothetical protein